VGDARLMRIPHPFVLLLGGTCLAAILTWIVPAGEFDRRNDPDTGRQVAVAGSYHPVPAAPVGPFAAAVAIPRGFVDAADVVGVVIFVGGAWIVVDRLGTLSVLVAAFVRAFRSRGLVAIPLISIFFAVMGALENMQEEIIPLVPALLVLGTGLGIDAVTVVAMSAGAAMIGSAFGPTNPFQAGIAMRLAQLPPFAAAGLRLAMFVAAVTAWIAVTMWHASRTRLHAAAEPEALNVAGSRTRHAFVLASVLLPMAIYVYGALRLDWTFNELSAVFFVGAIVAGLLGGMGLVGSLIAYIEGMQMLLPSAVMVGFARSISLVLADGHVVDSILNALAAPLAGSSRLVSSFLQVPLHAIVHVAVPSVSGQAVLTMPLLVPLADVLSVSRQVPVLTFQTGAGLTELLTPTNGALMAVLLAAGVSYQRWVRFAILAIAIPLLVGLVGIAIAALGAP
jgi:uncharacterized ion transporter superfamily protein YfcC